MIDTVDGADPWWVRSPATPARERQAIPISLATLLDTSAIAPPITPQIPPPTTPQTTTPQTTTPRIPSRIPSLHALRAGAWDLWCFQADDLVATIDPTGAAVLQSWLDPEERSRWQRFKFARDRDRFWIRRIVLRLILAQYTGQAPGVIAFRAGAWGKPCVLPAAATAAIPVPPNHGITTDPAQPFPHRVTQLDRRGAGRSLTLIAATASDKLPTSRAIPAALDLPVIAPKVAPSPCVGLGSAQDPCATNSGNTNSGNTNSGNTNSGNTNSGNTNSGNTNSGSANPGNANSGNANSGNANSGNANSGTNSPPLGFDQPVQFSLSKSGPWITIAIGSSTLGPIGVDLEQVPFLAPAVAPMNSDLVDSGLVDSGPVDSDPGASERLAQQVLSPAEYAAYLALPPAHRLAAWLHLWTIREASLKAEGVGLGGLEQLRVTLPTHWPQVGRVDVMVNRGATKVQVWPFGLCWDVGAAAERATVSMLGCWGAIAPHTATPSHDPDLGGFFQVV